MHFHPRGTVRSGFTLIELLTVITIIMILVGMILSISGLVQNKQARAAAEGQMAAMSSAIESYKVDNGTVPRDFAATPGVTDTFDPRTGSWDPNNAKYKNASLVLYKELSGDTDANRTRNKTSEQKSYFTFKPSMLAPAGGTGTVTAIVDPFGYSFGYSTARNYEIEVGTPNPPTKGYNPTFDLWSTGGAKTEGDKGKWIKNW